jgi:hypothetical protein
VHIVSARAPMTETANLRLDPALRQRDDALDGPCVVPSALIWPAAR